MPRPCGPRPEPRPAPPAPPPTTSAATSASAVGAASRSSPAATRGPRVRAAVRTRRRVEGGGPRRRLHGACQALRTARAVHDAQSLAGVGRRARARALWERCSGPTPGRTHAIGVLPRPDRWCCHSPSSMGRTRAAGGPGAHARARRHARECCVRRSSWGRGGGGGSGGGGGGNADPWSGGKWPKDTRAPAVRAGFAHASGPGSAADEFSHRPWTDLGDRAQAARQQICRVS